MSYMPGTVLSGPFYSDRSLVKSKDILLLLANVSEPNYVRYNSEYSCRLLECCGSPEQCVLVVRLSLLRAMPLLTCA